MYMLCITLTLKHCVSDEKWVGVLVNKSPSGVGSLIARLKRCVSEHHEGGEEFIVIHICFQKSERCLSYNELDNAVFELSKLLKKRFCLFVHDNKLPNLVENIYSF